MKLFSNDFFTSGWDFQGNVDLKNKFQMMNIAIILSSIAVIYGVIINFTIRHDHMLGVFELLLLCLNIYIIFLLRKDQKNYNLVATIETTFFSLLLISLIYISSPDEMKHVWFFTYPIVMLYTQNIRISFLWFAFLITMVLLAPFQPFVEISYSFYQLFYLCFVLVIVSIIVYFYKVRMEDARATILEQQNILRRQVQELQQKDKLLSIQSKQAVMGEMISMIAHQWRQPLSTVTLSISNIQVKKMLGQKIEEKELENALENISDTVVYLSETIDDFQTYFNPNRQLGTIAIGEIIDKVINFTKPRLAESKIVIEKVIEKNVVIDTYINELVQVLLNVVNNAVDELIQRKIASAKIKIDVKNLQESIEITIEDNAGGVKDINLHSIFEPYISTKGKNGTGLGLYMSQMIMQKQFESHLEVTQMQKGLLFSMKIPKKLS